MLLHMQQTTVLCKCNLYMHWETMKIHVDLLHCNIHFTVVAGN